MRHKASGAFVMVGDMHSGRRRLKEYVIVFGAAVRRNGNPSAALRLRINLAVKWARENPDSIVLPTGGAGKHGPAEARVMRRALIDAGIASDRIIVEPRGRDTLESVRLCDRLLRERNDCRRVVCCTSRYHQPRCALLFRLLGYEVVLPEAPTSLRQLRRRSYARLILKEIVATPYDALLLLRRKAAVAYRIEVQ